MRPSSVSGKSWPHECMEPGRASVSLGDVAAVIAILEAIPNNISALPAVGSPAPLSSGAPASGGFAAKLAAAQGVAAASGSQTAADEAATSEGSVAESAGTAANLNGRIPWGNTPAKKLTGGNLPLQGSAWSGANMVVPGFVPAMANQILLSLQTNAIRVGAPEPALNLIPRETSGHADGQETAPVGVGHLPVLSTSMGESFSAKLSSVISAPSAETPYASILSNASAISSADSIAQPASGISMREVAPVGVTSDLQGESVSAEDTLLAENTSSSSLSTANAQPISTASWQNAALSPAGGVAIDGTGNDTADAIARAGRSEPTLLARVDFGVGPAAGVQSSAGASVPYSPASASAPAENPIDPAAQPGTGNGPPAILSGALPALPALNPVGPLAARSALRGAAPRAEVASPGIRTAGATAQISTSASTSLTNEAGNESTAASQTPFSIFFSSPGPGTESAASALPKMILPATNSSIRDIHIGSDGSNVSVPSAAHGGGSTSNVAQNAAPPDSGDTNAGPSGSLSLSSSISTAQALHADPAVVAAAPAAAAPSPAGADSSAATLPLVQPVTSIANTKASSTTPAAGNPATPLPASPDAAPVPATGPVQIAQMVSRVGQAEMRIGVNTSAFGSVEVRTVVHASDVGLTIGSEKGDLRGLLGNEMPAITNSLQQQNLRLSSINFTQGFASSSHGSEGGNSHQQSFVPVVPASASSSSSPISPEIAAEDFTDPRPLAGFSGGSGSLSILA
jgi:hypothetical protein